MELAGESSKAVPVSITEDEAAVYDRQIRLWGLEAQQRMRNATILIITLKGTATETIKNIVLAGIGRLVVADPEPVSPEDLGAGFFFREEDVGKKRVDAAKSHIQNLNPLVTIEMISSPEALQAHGLENLVNGVDLVCLTDNGREMMSTVNSVCRRLNKPFYAGGTYGLTGYIFCDLLTHEHIAPNRVNPKEGLQDVRASETYCTLEQALTHKWTAIKKREVKALNCATVFSIMALWEFQARQGVLPNDPTHAAEIQEIADAMLAAANVNPAGLASIPSEMTMAMATTSAHEFSPVCAVLGGMLGQDILKALAAREPPIANFFTFDGITGAGSTVRMGLA